MGNLTLPRNPDTLGAIIFALREALLRAGTELARHHGNAPGPWLDELEAKCVQSVKTSTTNASLDLEASIMRDALTVLNVVFNEIRLELAKKN